MGEFQHTIDAKGRLIMPSKFREALGDAFVATKGLEHCLFVFPTEEWQRLEKKLKSLSFTSADARAFARFFFSGATECEVDKQGRILIPGNLREYAKLEKDVVVTGVSDRVEIWNKEAWDNYSTKAEATYEDAAEKLVGFDLGI